jgi:hypothetical protein
MSTARLSFALTLATLASSGLAFAQVPPPPNTEAVVVSAQLSGGNEVPPPTQATGAHGNARVFVDRAAGRITYQVNVYNLPTGLTGAHIHVGPAGSNGPIIFDFRPQQLGISNDFSLSGTLTAADLRPNAATGINSFEDAIFAIAAGVTYVNVHTQAVPSGEIRGQLCPDAPLTNRLSGVAVCTAR